MMEKDKVLKKIKELEHLEKVYITYSSTYNEKDTQPIRESLLKQAKSIRKEIEELKKSIKNK
jgi:phage host-nuclease inhibitor protein Gam